MKKILLALLGISTFSLMSNSFASAAPVLTSHDSGSSPYIGATLGYADTRFSSVTYTAKSENSDGSFSVGLVGGYEFRFKHFSLAGEANITGYNTNARFFYSPLGTLRYQYNSSYGFDLLPGCYISDQVKLFLIGGYQGGSFKFKNNFAGNNYSKNRTLGGWDAGLGTDIILNDHFTLRFAYKYIDYNSTRITATNWNQQISPTSNQFNLGILYRFHF